MFALKVKKLISYWTFYFFSS